MVQQYLRYAPVSPNSLNAAEYGAAAAAAAACGYGAPDPRNAVEANKITKQVDAYVTYGASDNTKSIAMR
jgi:hypothetical protein